MTLRDEVSIALESIINSDHMQIMLAKDPWLQRNINKANSQFQASRQRGEQPHESLNALLDSLLPICDASLLEQLRIIEDTLPRYPLAMAPDARITTYVDKSWRFFATAQELKTARNITQRLARNLGLNKT